MNWAVTVPVPVAVTAGPGEGVRPVFVVMGCGVWFPAPDPAFVPVTGMGEAWCLPVDVAEAADATAEGNEGWGEGEGGAGAFGMPAAFWARKAARKELKKVLLALDVMVGVWQSGLGLCG